MMFWAVSLFALEFSGTGKLVWLYGSLFLLLLLPAVGVELAVLSRRRGTIAATSSHTAICRSKRIVRRQSRFAGTIN